ncbi:hypothetical protein conserved [Leishmania donovani]|uniref:Uncharacterized protein n=3 Tax=Leishmania donovani species complex TaxID=38574 RepID=A4HSE0_LEIIN|nr:conserved hypothetical protein [Leishmania infantum JPCM5]XP_003858198.1 hypothetical protein, conserved [Leishmania donovani]CAC9442776.1 hypothetical_protein_-_conserved [Leishmania infantum]AYU75916.1 hypothetical protein LdCL_050006000 [Leishmania donovani]TPP44024.1 hypothetical protein CGC21_9305 [Leishmania donovani]TPP51886.1 hypothetical protein CGC20_24535 [Leishmania donovani]CAJ1985982.1 hypothetical protein conserved [Leishmania donovani]|eukprot:XP_001462981.1 conserved hypothetical protein [Leishmania infantum JPCM5]
MQTCGLVRLQFLLNTPFDHQPIAVPAVPTARSVIEDIIPPRSELSRVDEVGLLLKHLPAACDKAKQLQHDAQYASRYYRARFSRGSQLQWKHATQVAAASGPAEVQQWARSRLYPISDPFQCE